MDNHSNHSKTWSDADIRMYLNGELSPRERHDLERAALDDPFLADALDGFSTVAPPDTGLDDLRSRLAARVEKEKEQRGIAWFRRPIYRAAAIFIGLAGIGLTALYTLTPGKQKLNVDTTEVAKATTHQLPPPTAPAPSEPTTPVGQASLAATDSTVAGLDTVRASSATYANVDKPANARKPSIARKQTIPRNSSPADLVPEATSGLSVMKDTAQLQNDRATAMQQGFFSPSPATIGQQSLVFSGRVVDNNNHPLAGASVFLNNAPKTMTTTDAGGNFNFRLQPRDTTQQMTVALVGYKQTLVSLNANALTNNIIQLEEAKAALNEVVVTGYGAKRKETYAKAPLDDRSERLDTAWLKVAPVIGKLAYQQYLDMAKRSLKLDSTIYGTERISFLVDQKGQITEFKIEQSISPAHDAGVIQLITTGPAWQVLKGRKARALVSMSFP